MSDKDRTISADVEINILAAAYTVYCEFAENPLPPDRFREKFIENGAKFSGLVLGVSEG